MAHFIHFLMTNPYYPNIIPIALIQWIIAPYKNDLQVIRINSIGRNMFKQYLQADDGFYEMVAK